MSQQTDVGVRGILCICRFQARVIGLCLLIAAAPAQSTPHTEPIDSNGLEISQPAPCSKHTHYTILQIPRDDCSPSAATTIHALGAASTKHDPADAPLDPEWMQTEVLAFAVIGVAQIRGGTRLLSDIWYAGALLVPPFMEQNQVYGTQLNYLAIAPPFISLGLLNAYLHQDRAENPRVFISNFVGFNLALLWSRAVRNSPQNFLAKPAQLKAGIFPLETGAGIHLAYRW